MIKKITALILAIGAYCFAGAQNISLSPISGFFDGDIDDLILSISSDIPIKALQCDIYLPEGLSINKTGSTYDVSLIDTSTDHTVTCRFNTRKSAYSIVVLSTSSTAFSVQNGPILKAVLQSELPIGTYDIEAKNIRLVPADGNDEIKCGDSSAPLTINPEPIPSTSLVIQPTNLEIFIDREYTLEATVTPENYTDPLVWSSSDDNIATVDNYGKLTAKAKGTCTITATCGAHTSTCKVTVIPVHATSIVIDKKSLSMFTNRNVELVATVLPDDAEDKTVNWETSDEKIATYSLKGDTNTAIIHSHNAGKVTITATCAGLTDYCEIEVFPVECENIKISPRTVSLKVDSIAQLTATIEPTDADDQNITWWSSDESIVTVDENGLITAIAKGNALIYAKCGSREDYCKVSVSRLQQAIEWNQEFGDLHPGDVITLEATTTSGNPVEFKVVKGSKICTLEDNLLTVTGIGEIDIKATSPGNGKYNDAASVTKTLSSFPVYPQTIVLNLTETTLRTGETVELTATILPENATDKSLKWESNNENVAKVSTDGVVTAIGIGEATIIVVDNGEKATKATCTIVVEPRKLESLSFDIEEASVNIGAPVKYEPRFTPDNADNVVLTWESSDSNIATVDANGYVTGKEAGVAIIKATSDNGCSASYSVEVKPVLAEGIAIMTPEVTLLLGDTKTLKAILLNDNITDPTITWQSSDETIVTVSNNGELTAIGLGEATITARCGDVSDKCTVTVKPVECKSVKFPSHKLSMLVDEKKEYVPTILPANTTDKNLTWKVKDNDIISITDDGEITALKEGAITIMASCGEVSDTCRITVKKHDQSIQWDQDIEKVYVGETIELTAVSTSGLPIRYEISKGSKLIDLDNNILTIKSEGEIKIVASQEGNEKYKAASKITKSISAVNIIAQDITFSETEYSVTMGKSIKLNVVFTPAQTSDKALVWTSSDPSIAEIDQNGVVTAKSVGTVTITASSSVLETSCTLIVEPILATAIKFEIESLQLPMGASKNLTVTFIPSDVTNKTLEWHSSDTDIVTVDEKGTIKAIKIGKATVTATTTNDLYAECQVTVTEAPTTGITLSHDNLNLYLGENESLTLTIYSEIAGETPKWETADEKVATVDATGIVTATGVGETTITVKYGDRAATCKVTVIYEECTSIKLNKTVISMPAETTERLIADVQPVGAKAQKIIWTSSDEAIATIDEDGLITAHAKGTATITATCGSKEAQCQVDVTKKEQTITWDQNLTGLRDGDVIELNAAATSGLPIVYVIVKGSSCCEISGNQLTIKGAGEIKLTATQPGNEVYASATEVTRIFTTKAKVANNIKLDQESLTLLVNESRQLHITNLPDEEGLSIAWTSSNEDIATVDKDGNVLAIAVGVCKVTVEVASSTTTEDLSGECLIIVNPLPNDGIYIDKTTTMLKVGDKEQLIVTIYPSDAADKTVVWAISDSNIVTVDSEGNITAIGVGTATITAKWGTYIAECTVTVMAVLCESITLDITELSMRIDDEATLTATLSPANATTKDLKWTSSAENVVTVDASGVVKALATGSATITVTCDKATAKCKIAVNKKLQEIIWDQSFDDLKVGDEVILDATATSGLEVAYEITKGSKICQLEGNTLTIIGEGEIKITATQAGNEKYKKADAVVRSFNTNQAALLGDVNLDNSVNVTDVVITIDHILGNNPKNFNKINADINGDNAINVTDVVMIIDIILNGNK